MEHSREHGDSPERAGIKAPSRLADFARERQAEILLDWEREARKLTHAQDLDRLALVDHVPELLDCIAEMADDLASGGRPSLPREVAERHAIERLEEGFDLSQVVAEFSLLRDSIMRLWERDQLPASQLADVRLLNQALDRAISESVDRYTKARDSALQGLDRIASAAFESTDLEDLLRRLLQVLIETTPSVDTATVLLREGDRLCVRAAVGLEDETIAGFTLAIGEGFAGRIAAERRPMFLQNASTHPLVKSLALKEKGLRGLYGLPLAEGGEVIGVVQIGSFSAAHFSDQDKRLLSTLANRATMAISQHLLRESAVTRARQQEVVAGLGIFALETVNVQAIMQRAVSVVADTLGVELAKILELLPDGESLVLRAGVGWDQGLVGHTIVDAGRESHAGFTLASAEPVVFRSLATETRFKGSRVLREHGVVSGMSAIIHATGAGGRPYGIFSTHTRTERAFTPGDVSFLQAVANVVATAIVRRKTEEELRAAETQLSLYPEHVRLLAVLADSVPILVSYVDPGRRYRLNNKAYEEWFGRSRGELQGMQLRDVIGEAAYERIEPHLDAALEGHPVHYEQEMPFKSGTRHVDASYFPDRAPNGAVAGFVEIVADITEKKRAEAAEKKARAEAERALAVVDALLSSSLIGFGFIDTELRYARVNEALAEMNGRPVSEHLGRTVADVLGKDAEVTRTIEAALRKVLATGEAIADIELTAARPSKTDGPRSFLANFFPVRTPSGETIGIGAAVLEITERKRFETELRLSEARLQSILRNAPAAIYIKDADGRFVVGNERLSRILERGPDAIVGLSDHDVLPKTFADALRAHDRDVLEKGEPIVQEEAVPQADGVHTFISVKFPVPGPEGQTFLGGISTDITDRKRMEEKLRERELRFRALADNIPQLAWMADEKGWIFWYNQRWFDYTGTTLDEMQGWGWQKVHHPDHVERVVEKIRHSFSTGAIWEDMFPLRGRDGRYRWFLSRAIPIVDDEGRVERWFGSNTDVTDQRFLAEASRRLSESIDPETTFQTIARLAVPHLGDYCFVDLLVGDGLRRVAWAHADAAKESAFAARLQQAVPPLSAQESPIVQAITRGETILAPEIDEDTARRFGATDAHRALIRALGARSAVVVPMRARGRILGVFTFTFTTDSDRRHTQAEKDLASELARRAAVAVENALLYEEAQRAVRMREEILAVVSHDLKNPLGAIQLAGALLLGRPGIDPRSRKQVETINRSVSRMDHLIGDLLDMASIQAGRLAIECKPEEADAVIMEAVETNEPAAREKAVALVRVSELQGVRLPMDRDRILQVFGNLLGNAIKFCRPGDGITVRGERSGNEVRFAVSDTGPGIPESDLPRVFEPYWSAKHHAKKGTGLGLYISRGVIEAHGGRLWVESKPGEGATFHFTLPIDGANSGTSNRRKGQLADLECTFDNDATAPCGRRSGCSRDE